MNLKDISPRATANKMNTVMESRFGYAIDFSKLTFDKATRLRNSVHENINRIRKSFGAHTAERNPKYMELFLVRESLTKWLNENRQLNEGEMGKSSAILAAKDMVDSIQDMLEKVSKMQVEQMPALLDTIRDQIGNEQAESFKGSLGQLLISMVDQLTQARDQADTAARQLAGEQVAPGGMGMPGEMPAAPGSHGEPSDMEQPELGDEFGASDAAAGGSDELGRELR